MESPKPKAKHTRRPRYRGTHPRKFEEKYKELNPQKYTEDLKKVLSRGATPAGSHRPICLHEILKILEPKAGDVALDVTLGYGGHSQHILERLSPGGTLIGLDQDPLEGVKTQERLIKILPPKTKFIFGSVNFRNSRSFLLSQGLEKVDLVLADLGISSMQLDTPERGFSYKIDAPLDLRMNPEKGEPAWKILKSLSTEDLRQILVEYSDEPHARQIAQALVKEMPQRTVQVAQIVRNVLKGFSRRIQENEGDTPIARVFQALRILVNEELSALDEFLNLLPSILSPKGRVAILSFHSGEDRLVKKAFKWGQKAGHYSDISEELIRPSMEEQRSNPRSKSAKLRWAKV